MRRNAKISHRLLEDGGGDPFGLLRAFIWLHVFEFFYLFFLGQYWFMEYVI